MQKGMNMNRNFRLTACITSLLLLGAILITGACQKESDSDEVDAGTDGGTDGDTDSDTDTDTWADAYTMPFEIDWFEWANVPDGAQTPTVETFAGKVLLINFFQKW